MAAMWDAKQKQADEESKRSIFSSMFSGGGGAGKGVAVLRPGDPGYGKAPEGSASAARSKRANQWVRQQVEQLVQVVGDIGTAGEKDGLAQVTFKKLFIRWVMSATACCCCC